MGDRHFQLTSLCADLHQARLPQCLKSSSVWRKEHKSCDVNDDPWLCVNLSRTAVIFVRRVQQNLSAGGAFLQRGRFRLIVADAVDEFGVECHRRAIPDPLLVPGQAQWVRNPGQAGARGYCWNRKPQIMTVFHIRNLKGCEAPTAVKWKLVGLTLHWRRVHDVTVNPPKTEPLRRFFKVIGKIVSGGEVAPRCSGGR